MKYTPILPAALLFAMLLTLHAADPTHGSEVPLAFVQTHCVDCHNDSTSEGSFRVDLLSTNLADTANHKAWSRVLALFLQLCAGVAHSHR